MAAVCSLFAIILLWVSWLKRPERGADLSVRLTVCSVGPLPLVVGLLEAF
jgi:hypothetical protein